MEPQIDILSDDITLLAAPKRRTLLPWWVKIFCWIFMIFGCIAAVGIVFGILGYNFQLSLYGLDSSDPFSLIGGLLMLIFLLKGVAAFALWTEKDWAITLGVADAVLGIVVCGLVMFAAPFLNIGINFNLRLELALLIPYLLWLNRTKPLWQQSNRP